MPALLTILTERDIRDFSEGNLPAGQSERVLDGIRQDEKARAYYRRLTSQAGLRCDGPEGANDDNRPNGRAAQRS